MIGYHANLTPVSFNYQPILHKISMNCKLLNAKILAKGSLFALSYYLKSALEGGERFTNISSPIGLS